MLNHSADSPVKQAQQLQFPTVHTAILGGRFQDYGWHQVADSYDALFLMLQHV